MDSSVNARFFERPFSAIAGSIRKVIGIRQARVVRFFAKSPTAILQNPREGKPVKTSFRDAAPRSVENARRRACATWSNFPAWLRNCCQSIARTISPLATPPLPLAVPLGGQVG